jgi:transcriptional regulator with XRE-family HTH domain
VVYEPLWLQNHNVATNSSLRALAVVLRRRREEVNLTQEDVAYESGISVRHYQKIEAGITDPRFLTLQALAKVLRITLPRLLERPLKIED